MNDIVVSLKVLSSLVNVLRRKKEKMLTTDQVT